MEAVRWWEKKRILYSVIALSGGLLVMFGRSELPNGVSTYSAFFILGFLLFGANIFYTCGWGAEILLNYYFKTPYWGNVTRKTIFVLGSIFSFFWMFLVIRELP